MILLFAKWRFIDEFSRDEWCSPCPINDRDNTKILTQLTRVLCFEAHDERFSLECVHLCTFVTIVKYIAVL